MLTIGSMHINPPIEYMCTKCYNSMMNVTKVYLLLNRNFIVDLFSHISRPRDTFKNRLFRNFNTTSSSIQSTAAHLNNHVTMLSFHNHLTMTFHLSILAWLVAVMRYMCADFGADSSSPVIFQSFLDTHT